MFHLPRQPRLLVPLRFGAATSDRVEVPASTLHQGLTQHTVLMIVRPSTLTSGRRLYQKEVGTTDWGCELSGTGGNLDCYHGFTTGFTQRITSDTPLARLNRYVQVATVLRALNDMSVYHGLPGTSLKESTYGTQTNTATGTPLTAANPFIWANRNTNNLSFQGDIAFGAIVGRAMSLAEVNDFFLTGVLPRVTRFASVFGANGRGSAMIDVSGSGLHSAVTGAIPREPVAVRWLRPGTGFVATAGGGGTPQELAATGTVEVEGSAALEVQKPLGATGTVQVEGTAGLQVTKALAASGVVQAEGSAELAVEKPLSATGVVEVEGSAQLTGAVEMAATGTVLVQGSADLQVGAVVVLELISRTLLFTRTVDRDLLFTRTITRDLEF